MYLIFCVDDQYGLKFNHRRQSRDSKVIEDIIDHIEGNVLLVNPYSSVLFKNYSKANIKVSEQPEVRAMHNEYCFMEQNPSQELNYTDIQGIILYHWNRKYPVDTILDPRILNFIKNCKTAGAKEFPGSSHENIRKEIFINEKI